MARLLGVVPWVVEQDGAHLDDIAARFDYPREQLLEDLEQRLFFVGVHPFTPDTLIEVRIEDGIVDIQYADWFSQPMRLSPDEATRLLAAGRSVLYMTGGSGRTATGDDDGAAPLVRALAKLTLSLGSEGADGADYVEVCLGHAPSHTLTGLRGAISARRQIEIEYYSQGRDVMTTRTVDPARLLSHDGVWYLFGWCHRAGAERVFRVDRIRTLAVLASEAQVDLPAGPPPALKVDTVDRTVTIRLAPEAAWAGRLPRRAAARRTPGRLSRRGLRSGERVVAGPCAGAAGTPGGGAGLRPGHRPGPAGRHRGTDAGPVPAMNAGLGSRPVSPGGASRPVQDTSEEQLPLEWRTPPHGPLDGDDAGQTPPTAARRAWSVVSEWLVVGVCALGLALLLKAFLVEVFVIPSGSMEPTLMVDNRVVVYKLGYRLHEVNRGDVIVFHHPGQAADVDDLIKRVVALGGETFEIRGTQVYIDGARLEEPYLPPAGSTHPTVPIPGLCQRSRTGSLRGARGQAPGAGRQPPRQPRRPLLRPDR